MGPKAARQGAHQDADRQNTITTNVTLSERADAIEEHMMHELDKIITKSVFSNLTDGVVGMEGGAVPQAKNPGKYFNMGPDPRLPPVPETPRLMDYFKNRLASTNDLPQCAPVPTRLPDPHKVV